MQREKQLRGRPKQFKKSTRITFDMENVDKRALLRIADDAGGMRISELMRMLVDEFVTEQKMFNPQLFADMEENQNDS